MRSVVVYTLFILGHVSYGQTTVPVFNWPDGYEMALSLTFDDGRTSQVDGGAAILDHYGAKATFYVMPGAVERDVEGWNRIAEAGHEIGNHSIRHACTGNFTFSKDRALENYDIEMMEAELLEANRLIHSLLGVTPVSFAYPCGEMFVGRGLDAASYIPVIARHFKSGRGWLGETANDPAFCDLAHIRGREMDSKDFSEIRELIDQARENGYWLVLAGHEIGHSGKQTTRISMLEELLTYLQKESPEIWLAPVGEIAAYIEKQRR